MGYEAQLWQMADALRGSMDAAEYTHVVLGLIFLKYVSDAFEEQHTKFGADKKSGADPEDPDAYRALSIFWVPPEARRAHLKAQARQPTIGQLVDDAMAASSATTRSSRACCRRITPARRSTRRAPASSSTRSATSRSATRPPRQGTSHVLWDGDDGFDFRILDSVEELEASIRQRHAEGFTSRLTAGFCWPWSKPLASGRRVRDVKIGEWSMPWNAMSDAGSLARGIPKDIRWASHPDGIERVGCVDTAQGFDFDYCGVIFGRDLRYDPITSAWIGDPSVSHDREVKKGSDRFLDLVKNTCHVLLTRAMKGCYVVVMDEATKAFVRSRIERASWACTPHRAFHRHPRPLP